MQVEYRKEMALPAVYLDRTCHLGLYQSGLLLQDTLTELFHQYECDAIRMSRSHGAVWAVARTKFRFLKRPFWLDPIVVRAYPVKVTPAAVHVEMAVETPEGQPLLYAKQEVCALDMEGHSLRRIDATPFPRDLPLPPSALSASYRRMKFQLEEETFRRVIRATDTDMNGHMNNAASLRLAEDAFSSGYWAAHPVTELDLHYAGEGMEGQTLSVRREETEDGAAVQLKDGDRTVLRAFFRTETAKEDCIPEGNPVH